MRALRSVGGLVKARITSFVTFFELHGPTILTF